MFGILFWIFVFLILYTYFGYPLLVILLAKLKPKVKTYPYSYPSVSLVIAAYNEEQILEAKIKNSLALNYPKDKLQILVANDCSSDRTEEIAKRFSQQGVGVVTGFERLGKIGNINTAVKTAEGDIIVISDATNMYDPDAMKELMAPFADPEIGIVGGVHMIYHGEGLVGDSEGLYWKYETKLETSETRLGNCITVNGDILAIRKELWQDIPTEVINDDLYLALKAIKQGKRVLITPKAIGRERISPTAKDEIVRRSRMVAGHFQAMAMSPKTLAWRRPGIVWQVISHKFMRPLVPFWMIGAFLVSLGAVIFPAAGGRADLLTLAQPFNWLFFVLQCLVYLLAWVGNAWENKSTVGFLYLPTFLVNSNIAALKGFWRYISRQQTNRWQRVERRAVES
jgi:cellulose synthase/poly-beta-1,6-N-acetylglucosamine synthase-like glycosyltransferase